MPHHPGDLFIAAEGAQPGKKRLELRPAQQFVGRKTERIEVAGRPDRAILRTDQLRGHVLGRPLQQAAFLVADAAGQAEIAELHAAQRIEQQVARLHVTVNHAVLVQEVQGIQAASQHHAEKIQVDRLALGRLLQAAPHQLQNQPAAAAPTS